MIRAAESNWFKRVWHFYVRYYLLWRHFSILRLKGEIDTPQMFASGKELRHKPVIYIANHSNWWDGLLAFDAYLPRTTYKHFVMMDEKQLRHYQFFTKLGVFSIDKTKPSAVMESLQYATELLREQHAVWIFPQGDIEHLEQRPIRFFSGVAYLLQQCPEAVVVPVTLYYSFCHRQRPEASIWFGDVVAQPWQEWERKATTVYLREHLQTQLDVHRQLYMDGVLGGPAETFEQADHGFETTLRVRTTDEWFVQFKRWVKSWFMRSRR
jgi:1-acyl-sn-glycerol-3-phosphate acyltransferase